MIRSARPTRLLFLDFDGVLHPTSATPSGRFACTPILAEALADAACEIVISSSWRHHHELTDLVTLLPSFLGNLVVGSTGEASIGKHARFMEIQAYLRDFAPGATWRALDDSLFEFPPRCPELIACDPNFGFTFREAGRLRRWLTAQGESI